MITITMEDHIGTNMCLQLFASKCWLVFCSKFIVIYSRETITQTSVYQNRCNLLNNYIYGTNKIRTNRYILGPTYGAVCFSNNLKFIRKS